MEFLMIILMATLLLAVVFGLGVTWGAWSEFQAEKNNWQEMGVCKQSFGNATATPAKWQCDLDAFRPSESDTVTRRLAALERIAK